ncbi:phosphatidylinositol 4-kinase alpha 1-like isoform X2 [Magnolia sinica]|uniref:phosphatidylinositol 4-kinase alpha 1-like isoform X2 n=1 Tax=Magnolia sinica TaxID=86752 RepID=UPI002657EE52|nr:phosphatidylinositol 4-kinase alpha 1-like isoform X2 [Magnolia sinica]
MAEASDANRIVECGRLLQRFLDTAEKGGAVDEGSFRETCSEAISLLLSNQGSDSKSNREGLSQLLHLLCWCPAYILTPEAMETGVFNWTSILSAAPQLGSDLLQELVGAWLWTIKKRRGLFACGMRYSGPAGKLRPHVTHGEPQTPPEKDPVDGIMAHRLWLGFIIDHFKVVQNDTFELLLKMLKETMEPTDHFSRHPAAAGTFFTVMLLGLEICSCQHLKNLQNWGTELHLLENLIYRASLGWFAYEPEWYDNNDKTFAQNEAQSVSIFVQHLSGVSSMTENFDPIPLSCFCAPSCLMNQRVALPQKNSPEEEPARENHKPVGGEIQDSSVEQEKQKQLLLMLCQHEVDRLNVWAQPVHSKKSTFSHSKINSEKWIEYAGTAFSVDPRIALSLPSRFPANSSLRVEVTRLVQLDKLKLCKVPEALPFLITPETVDENSVLLQQLSDWDPCSITQALKFLAPPYKGHSSIMGYVLGVLKSYPPEMVNFFMLQLVQALRYDEGKLLENYLLEVAQSSEIFAHSLIWHLQGSDLQQKDKGKKKRGSTLTSKDSSFEALLPNLRQRIIDSFSSKATQDLFQHEAEFFDKVTSISGVLVPLPKEARRAGIQSELEKIKLERSDIYLPTATNKLVHGIQLDSGIPLQSAEKVPIMITFDVVDRDGNHDDVKPQACIFKVGDDCRQDALALQVISLLRDIFEAVGLSLYLFPFGVIPTGPGSGIIEVVPNARSRNQMGKTAHAGLYEIFQQEYGAVGSAGFEAARNNFISSSAGYAIASLLLQIKDRNSGNLLFDNVGRLVHIDFGFLLGTSPANNMGIERAHFKLSRGMTKLLDPSGVMKSDTWIQFVRCMVVYNVQIVNDNINLIAILCYHNMGDIKTTIFRFLSHCQ